MDKDLLDYLSTYVTAHKKQKMDKVLSMRTRKITVVIENLHKAHNGSAVLRTCECFGLQDIHFIEKKDKYKANPYVTRGSSKWMDIFKYSGEGNEGTKLCFETLREQGYKLYATVPEAGSVPLEEIGVSDKIALLFGNEFEGLSEYALSNADGKISLPMYGFTESFNISVTAAICLHTLVTKLRYSGEDWSLSGEEKAALKLAWLKKVIKRSEIIEKKFYNG